METERNRRVRCMHLLGGILTSLTLGSSLISDRPCYRLALEPTDGDIARLACAEEGVGMRIQWVHRLHELLSSPRSPAGDIPAQMTNKRVRYREGTPARPGQPTPANPH